MATQTRSPSTATQEVGAGNDWTTPNNVLTSNNQYCVGTYLQLEFVDRLKLEGFGFTIPAGSVIDEIRVYIELLALTTDGRVLFDMWRGLTEGSVSEVFFPGTSEAIFNVIGFGAVPLWGLAWTAEQINSDLIVKMYSDDALDNSGEVSVDHVEVRVTYSDPPPQPQASRMPTSNARW